MDVSGGAVEASWVLRTFDGRAISECSCSDPEVNRVRFVLARVDEAGMPAEDVCAGRPECEFACRRRSGATPFDIPPGRYAISIAPLDAAGQPLAAAAGAVRVPAPILRDVVFGRPAQVDAFSIEASCAMACGGETRVCSRD